MADKLVDFNFVNNIVMPGDIIGTLRNKGKDGQTKGKLKLGPGLKIDAENVVVYKCGVLRLLREKGQIMFWVDSDQKKVRHFCMFSIKRIMNKGLK